MAININKILTISAKEWFDIKSEKRPDQYEVHGVHSHDKCMGDGVLEDFVERVPSEAEVVVGYRCTSASSGSSGGMSAKTYAYGTALIPKNK